MQPFDALTMRAALQELRPLLLNRRLQEVYQLSGDEIVITLRGRSDQLHLVLSAHALFGRICLSKSFDAKAISFKKDKHGRSQFISLLKRDLSGATLIAMEQPVGERVVDLIFSCQNQVGVSSLNSLSLETMGRNSNIILWRRNDKTITTASHVVTKDMSRYREVLPGLLYIRPPVQAKPNIYKLTKTQFEQDWQLSAIQGNECEIARTLALENWLLSKYSGIGKNLASDLVDAAKSFTPGISGKPETVELGNRIWQMIDRLQTCSVFAPASRGDFYQYRVIDVGQSPLPDNEWLTFATVNDLIDFYYTTLQTKEVFHNLQQRLLKQTRSHLTRAEAHLEAQKQTIESTSRIEHDKLCGDLIFANLELARSSLASGIDRITCENIFAEPSLQEAHPIAIVMDSNLSAAENAQKFYQQYARAKRRKEGAQKAYDHLQLEITKLKTIEQRIEQSKSIEELSNLKQAVLPDESNSLAKKALPSSKNTRKPNFISATSSDGWRIYMGRNRLENDRLLRTLAQPDDIWLHVLGQSGSHVLIKALSTKNEPPMTTIMEAAQIAAYFSKAKPTTTAKVRVVYTQCRFVKKIGASKSGVVTYEREKTIEVNINSSSPKLITQLG